MILCDGIDCPLAKYCYRYYKYNNRESNISTSQLVSSSVNNKLNCSAFYYFRKTNPATTIALAKDCNVEVIGESTLDEIFEIVRMGESHVLY